LIDITIIGGGSAVRACTDLLTSAGFGLRRTFEFDNEDRSPIILGELPAAHQTARQAVDSGRHLLIANPSQFSPERLELLFDGRRRAQALFLWSTRRYHPSYRFVSSLIESDSTWQPRHLRHETLLTETASAGVANWTLLESAALVADIAGASAESVAASGAANPMRNANELMNLAIEFPSLRAFITIGLGEAVERRETLIAGQHRRVFLDELNHSVPVRLLSDDHGGEHPAARWLSTNAPSAEEMARQQCLAFLDSTLNPNQTVDEAMTWQLALAIVAASRQSLISSGAPMPVEQPDPGSHRFHVITATA
jgi:hypothetical protein